MFVKPYLNIDFKGVHLLQNKIQFVKATKEELESFEKEVKKGNPYISKVFEIIEEEKKEKQTVEKIEEEKIEVKKEPIIKKKSKK